MNQYDFDDSNYPRAKYVCRARIVLVVFLVVIVLMLLL